ncbi:hypothetical protein BF16_11490 [Brucella suis 1330]|nr:hypothetical protein BF16_11490 [Brucella suis 1330]
MNFTTVDAQIYIFQNLHRPKGFGQRNGFQKSRLASLTRRSHAPAPATHAWPHVLRTCFIR